MKNNIINWIKKQMIESNGEKIVVGMSGGKDSNVVAALAVEAIGKENVIGILMPNGLDKDKSSINKAVDMCNYLDIEYHIIDVGPVIQIQKQSIINNSNIKATKQMLLNIPPRIRMTTLYAVAQGIGHARVTCNSNLSEDTMGYATKYGDTAGDLAPIQSLTVREVKQLGRDLGLPSRFIDIVPEDGLTGITDEEVFGMTYDEIDDYILLGTSGNKEKDKIIKQKENYNKHKLFMPPKWKK